MRLTLAAKRLCLVAVGVVSVAVAACTGGEYGTLVVSRLEDQEGFLLVQPAHVWVGDEAEHVWRPGDTLTFNVPMTGDSSTVLVRAEALGGEYVPVRSEASLVAGTRTPLILRFWRPYAVSLTVDGPVEQRSGAEVRLDDTVLGPTDEEGRFVWHIQETNQIGPGHTFALNVAQGDWYGTSEPVSIRPNVYRYDTRASLRPSTSSADEPEGASPAPSGGGRTPISIARAEPLTSSDASGASAPRGRAPFTLDSPGTDGSVPEPNRVQAVSATAARAQGDRAYDQGRWQEAVNAYAQVPAVSANADRSVQQDYHQLLIRKGNALLQLRDYSAAETAYRQVLDVDPKAAAAHLNLMVTYEAWGKCDLVKRQADWIHANRFTNVPAEVRLDYSLHRLYAVASCAFKAFENATGSSRQMLAYAAQRDLEDFLYEVSRKRDAFSDQIENASRMQTTVNEYLSAN